ncbi:MAG: heat-inducible transcriptional repressor HrcA [Eubacteriales bacterium]|nr:heat-inducible transcriptional repressor HrcA [Eubacteriales bacterium]
MELSERKLKILRAIISSYIQEGEAVGSRTISKKHNMGISSATVRNEMSDLEELGYLIQPHTSAGRVPTDKAYRLYVNGLLKSTSVSKYSEQINRILQEEINEMNSFIKNSARILSNFTHYTSFAMTPQLRESRLKHIQLVPVSDNKILLVIVTENNIIKNVVFKMSSPIPHDQLNRISNLLTVKLSGVKLSMLNRELQNEILREIHSIRESFDEKLDELMVLLMNTANQYEKVELYYDGLTNILNYPEYSDTNKAKELLSFVEDRESFTKALLNVEGKDLSILIGKENEFEQIKECSIVTATYKLNGIIIGKVGLIGPTRMDYKNVISMVKSLSFNINKLINENYTDTKRSETDG